MSSARIASVLLLLVAACSESRLEPEAGALSRVVESAEEILAGLPPLCTTLRTDGYESRKVAVDEATDTQQRLASEACPEDLQRLADGRAVEEAAVEISGDDATVTFQRCAATRAGFEATITVTNGGPTPIGVYVAVRASAGNAPVGIGVVAIAWELAPGQSTTQDISGTGSGDSCAVELNVFLSDPDLGGDGSGPDAASAEQASDDPGVWFPALIEAEQAWRSASSPDIDGPARTEDLRSTAYPDLLTAVQDGTAEAPVIDGVTVCSTTPHPENPDLVTVQARLGDTVVAGPVRRGHDGAWRWLGTTLALGTGPCPS